MNLIRHVKRNSWVGKTARMSTVMLGAAVATSVLAAGGTGYGAGYARSQVSPPVIDQAPALPPPILNPSYSYTIPQTPEIPVSPASPGSIFGNGPTRP